MNLRQMQRLLDPLARRIRLLLDRAVVRIVDDSLQRQNLQVSILADETSGTVERFQNYGLTSVPPAGSEAVVAALGGRRAGLVAIAVEHKGVRPKGLAVGDVSLYHLEGHNLTLTKDGKAILTVIEVILQATEQITMIAPKTVIQGALHATGPITSDDEINSATELGVGDWKVTRHKHKDSMGGMTDEPSI